ncbi:MAG TPA: Na+/H+ antiporter subunit E [Microthrixaceae bacterium]|nr:Na+/H+ antiporter subunit E [Microthrixaceae bacterium]
MSRLTLGVCIVIGWMFLWGDVGVGPVIGGTLVVVTLYVVFPSSRASFPRVVVHPFAVARLFAYFVRQLVVSNALLTRELLRRRNSICTRVVEIPMRTSVPSLLTMVTNLASLSPGTIVVDADELAPGTPPTLVVHVLMFGDLDDPEAAVRSVHALEERCVLAFGTNDAIRELELAR